MTAQAERTIYVDGYNVIRNTPALAQAERISLADGRAALLARLATRYRHTPWRVVVVFDGDRPTESAHPFPGLARGEVVYSCAAESADAVIVRLAARTRAAGREATVISDDGEVRAGAQQFGAGAAHVADWQRSADAPPRLLRKRFSAQIAAQRQLARDEQDADDDADARRRHRKGNPRRTPRRRSQRRHEPPV